MDPRDWATKNAAEVEQAVLKHVADGDIVLLHDMTYSSVKAALNVVDALQNQGYRFVTVSELAKLRSARIRPGQVFKKFPREPEKPMK